jgi:hypothetical protein
LVVYSRAWAGARCRVEARETAAPATSARPAVET